MVATSSASAGRLPIGGNPLPTEKTTSSPAVTSGSRTVLRELGLYLVAILLSLTLLTFLQGSWWKRLGVTPWYSGDGLLFMSLVKGTMEHGWYLHNDDLGMPFGLDMHDFPMADGLHFFALKLLGKLTHHPIVAVTVYYYLGFLLTTLTSLFAMRRLGVSGGIAVVVSVL